MLNRIWIRFFTVSIYPYGKGWRGRFLMLYRLWHFLRLGCWWQKSMCCQWFQYSLQTSHLHLDRLHVRFRFFHKGFCLLKKTSKWHFLRLLHFQGQSQSYCCGELLKVQPALPGKFSASLASSMRKGLRLYSRFRIRFFGYIPEWRINQSAYLFPGNTS